ncbi:NAD-dependent epimerase [Halomicronema sp. CCY15110]|uniref:NAD-dependent epimerase n=1 Tax=Halomicronema sp. CCY15110 TaxID=2767773 RepID=UPI00194E30AE|nr:NAD-dependent epimerase [Halomicronema sp. CCY15110]
MTILITGAAGFIGFHVARKLLDAGQKIYGIDNLNDYYSVQLKCDRLAQLKNSSNFTFQQLDLNDHSGVETLFSKNSFTHVIHLAAQAGVRYSLQNPHAYADGNLSGFLNILEGCRHSSNLKHLIFASSSSVYGANTKVPFSTQDSVDHPVSLYAATKKANELMAHAYSHLYDFPVTGLRFFTVYGPWGRPDMAYFKFVDAIAHDRPIEVYNQGKMRRDFTYIDDVVEGIIRLLDHLPSQISTGEEINSKAQYKIYNIGNNQPVELMKFIEVIEKAMGKSAEKIMKPMQPGDVVATYADINDLMKDINFKPLTSVENGIQKFVEWYLSYYQKDR